MDNSFTFFKNISCKYYPCHSNIDEINCLFCYCPLFSLKDCGGNFIMINNRYKDCSNCTKPHIPNDGYNYVQEKLKKWFFKK